MRVLFCTAPADAAPILVRRLLEERLIACANILPGVRSVYWWQGVIQDDTEAVLWMETSEEHLEKAMTRLADLHPYEVPKVIAFDPAAVNGPYRAWLRSVVGG